MTLEEALSVVDQACASVTADRKTHNLISQALETIKSNLPAKVNGEMKHANDCELSKTR